VEFKVTYVTEGIIDRPHARTQRQKTKDSSVF